MATLSALLLFSLASGAPSALGQDWQQWEATWTRDQKMAVQESLIWSGNYYGLIDGQFGRLTRSAISDWQAMSGYQATGYLTPPQYEQLIAAAAAQRQDIRFGILLDPTTTFRVGFPYGLMIDYGVPVGQSAVEYSSIDYDATYTLQRFPCPTIECWDSVYASVLYEINDIVYQYQNSSYISANGISGDHYVVYFARRERSTAGILRIVVPRSNDLWLSIAIAVGTYFDPFNNRSIRLVPLQIPTAAPAFGQSPQVGGTDPTTPVSPPATSAQPATSGAPVVVGSGSGFFVDSVGHVVTNNHVVEGCNELRVIARDRQEAPARIIAADMRSDLAVLETGTSTLQHARLRVGPSIALGGDVIALGFPLGQLLGSQVSATRGNVSALAGIADDATMLTVTAPIQPGNSGGPLVDASGLVVGVVVATLDVEQTLRAAGTIPQNVNFAIKSLVLQAFLDANGVPYDVALPQQPDQSTPEQAAQQAAAYTVRIECLQ